MDANEIGETIGWLLVCAAAALILAVPGGGILRYVLEPAVPGPLRTRDVRLVVAGGYLAALCALVLLGTVAEAMGIGVPHAYLLLLPAILFGPIAQYLVARRFTRIPIAEVPAARCIVAFVSSLSIPVLALILWIWLA